MMTPENRVKFDDTIKAARGGDESALAKLRLIGVGLCMNAPLAAIVKITETFNDIYMDEQIEWAKNQTCDRINDILENPPAESK